MAPVRITVIRIARAVIDGCHNDGVFDVIIGAIWRHKRHFVLVQDGRRRRLGDGVVGTNYLRVFKTRHVFFLLSNLALISLALVIQSVSGAAAAAKATRFATRAAIAANERRIAFRFGLFLETAASASPAAATKN